MALPPQIIVDCCEEVVPPLEAVPTLNCDGTTEDIAQPQFIIAGSTKPIPVCFQNRSDFEVGCSDIDGRLLILGIAQQEDGSLINTLYESDGLTEVSDGSKLTKCETKDYEITETCYRDIDDNNTLYNRLDIIEVPIGTLTASIWKDSVGNIIAEPINIERCKEDKLNGTAAVSSGCNAIEIVEYSDTIRAIITDVITVKLANCCEPKEPLGVLTTWG